MDKKNLRQSLNKALSSEPHTSKQFPRNPKRRENQILPNSKVDTQRKSGLPSAKTRPNVDKRPKPRNHSYYGGNNSSTTGGANNIKFNILPIESIASGTRLAEDSASDNDYHEIELNSIYSQGSKKQNLNHLLNFHCPREKEANNGKTSSGRYGVFNTKYNVKKHRYNKEQFLQANFQFVINSAGKLQVDDTSPDTLVDWSLIEQINIQTTTEPQCPICLYPPVAAKLTRCGHVYCWSCVLHYLSLSDKSWRKCPICYEAIHINDLKSTVIVQQKNFNLGDTIKLQLMRREKGSILVEKLQEKQLKHKNNEKILHMSDDNDEKKFSKFLLAEEDEILSIVEREKDELMAQLDKSCPEFIFVQQALDLLNDRKSNLSQKKINENIDSEASNNVDEGLYCNLDSNEGAASGISNTVYDPSHYYFYQSEDGQNIFLHPLNVKMIQTMYGSLNQGPSFIDGKILQKESQSMDEDRRKKFSCLGHLPLTCQFEIVELQLEFPTISHEVIKMFKDDVLIRQKLRLRRAREESKREKQINEINERQMGKLISRSANIDIKSTHQFPLCGYEEFPTVDNLDALPGPSTSKVLISPEQTKFKAYSFANVLSSPQKKDIWPSLGDSSDVGGCSPSSTSTCVWGATSSFLTSARSIADKDKEHISSENESSVNFDLNSHNLGLVIADALLNTRTEDNDHNGVGSSNNGSGRKKKKNRNKKTLLFSTGMNFNGNN